ncbi:ArsR family transcriptional regulator [Natrinema sp. 1APR25-10V2]|uniref:ArsR family transcriptional regulator n=1 Tax=Natrinema sp. 1APR25-10V2 TaxID=2951081 RepID=UPI002874A143|nr:ArsR family transcriptional regulator [Natrinema sp. 1APR25-10V2]MDS0477713.1 ArsR family transcriptional regulator [Natrinema sp. 1APR25-10V2]
MLPTDDRDTILSTEDVLEAVTAIGDRGRLEVVYAVYAHPADGLTVSEIAAEVAGREAAVAARVDALVDGGVLAERMPCLVDPSVEGTEYELTEFGRLLLEEGVLALFDAAESVRDL